MESAKPGMRGLPAVAKEMACLRSLDLRARYCENAPVATLATNNTGSEP